MPPPRLPLLGAAVLAAAAIACAPPRPASPPHLAPPHRSAPSADSTSLSSTPPPTAAPGEPFSAARLEAAAALQRRDYSEAERLLAAEIERTGESDALLGDLAQIRALAVLDSHTKTPGSAAFDLAIAALDRAIARQPRSARLFALRGAIASRERRFAAARADFAAALALDPTDTDARLDAAHLAAAVHDFRDADSAYRALIAARPGDFDAWLARAVALRARLAHVDSDDELETHYRAARDAIASAVEADPSRPEAHYHFALLLLEHGTQRASERSGPALLLGIEVLRTFLEEAKDRPALAKEFAAARARYTELQQRTIGCVFTRRTEAEEARIKQQAAALEDFGDDSDSH